MPRLPSRAERVRLVRPIFGRVSHLSVVRSHSAALTRVTSSLGSSNLSRIETGSFFFVGSRVHPSSKSSIVRTWRNCVIFGQRPELRHAGPVTSINQRLLDKLKAPSRVACSD